MVADNPLFVGSLEKGFRVLKAFRRGQRELKLRDLSLMELAQLSGLDKSATQRFTYTLHKLGYLEKSPRTRRYKPSVNLLEFSYAYLLSDRMAETAMPRLIEASKRYNTTVNLCELVDTHIVYTIRIPHERAAYRATIPGRRIPAFCSAGGVAILSRTPEQQLVDTLERTEFSPITEWTITEPRKVEARIKRARKKGYDLGVQQALPYEISTAAPVLDTEGNAIAAVQIPVYMPEWTVEMAQEKIAPIVTDTARVISGSL
ncbi:MAG: IclR family transcriptional regulator [Hyphomicrobiales bacterium]